MRTLGLSVLAGVICGTVLSGCGSNPPSPSKVQVAWDNHFAAFGNGVAAQAEEDATEKETKTNAALDMILLDYDNDSVVRVWTQGGTSLAVHEGTDAIRSMFATLFGQLASCNGDDANKLKARDLVDDKGSQVFLVWTCVDAGFLRATDTFIFDVDDKTAIIRDQNIVVTMKTAGGAEKADSADSLVQFRRLQSNNLADAWENHAGAFMDGAKHGGDPSRDAGNLTVALDQIMKDYNAESIVRFFEFKEGKTVAETEFVAHEGPEEIREMFTNLFKDFTALETPVVSLAEQYDTPQVFLVWSAAANAYNEATDTFIYKKDGDNFMIHRQNIAVYRGS